jgi:hypothetical protein
VHEDDLPHACLFLQESRFQPLLAFHPGSVGDAAVIDVGNPGSVPCDVDVRFGHVPFKALALGMLRLDESHDGFSIESETSVEYIKVRRNDGIELRNIVCSGRSENCAHCVYDLPLIGAEALLLRSQDAEAYSQNRCKEKGSR